MSGLASEFFDDVVERLAVEVGIERQRPVGHAVPAFEIGRNPGVSIAQAPGQDRLRTHDLANRPKELAAMAATIASRSPILPGNS